VVQFRPWQAEIHHVERTQRGKPERRIVVPELGLGDAPLSVSLWLAKRGARLRAGDPVVEVLCGPATIDLPAPCDGVLAEKLAAEGEPVRAGMVVAMIRPRECP
jgi:pyruvate/2-oxoglutarate dehydrogenase complex dihydrolipoamide acyltransferase (E2) component